jgi:hypothetical protein
VASYSSYGLLSTEVKTVLGRIALDGLIVVVGMLLLAAQWHSANKRLANKRRNNDASSITIAR